MKRLIIVLLGFLFMSCEDRVLTDTSGAYDPYIVDKIERKYEGTSLYRLRAGEGTDYIGIYDQIDIVEINGKFKIGDTIYLQAYTKN